MAAPKRVKGEASYGTGGGLSFHPAGPNHFTTR